MLIDTHCHLEEQEYGDLELLIKQILETDVKILIVSGYDVNSSEEAIKLAKTFKNVYATVGFHPHESSKIREEDYDLFDRWMLEQKVIGIGEIGLDYYYDNDIIAEQNKMFERQLIIAEKYNKPVVVHNRNAGDDIYNIVKKYNVKGVIHCFNDDIVMANKFIDLGYLLGIGGIITFKNNQVKNVIKDIPLEYVVLETDSPYLSPEPFRGKKNSPANLTLVAEAISKIKKVEYTKVASITTSNANRLFDFKSNL